MTSRAFIKKHAVAAYFALTLTIMHASLTASTIFIFTPLATGIAFLTYVWGLAAALWVVVAAIAAVYGGQLSRQPLRFQAEGELHRSSAA